MSKIPGVWKMIRVHPQRTATLADPPRATALAAQLPLLWRVGWAAMLLGHAPAWFAALVPLVGGAGELHAARLVILTASQAFFVLKLLDVSWLRLRAERRVWLVATLGIALLHAGVISRTLDPQLGDDADPFQAVLVLGSLAGAIVCLLPQAQRIATTRIRTVRRHWRDLVSRIFAAAEAALLPPRYLLLARSCCVDRAPPR